MQELATSEEVVVYRSSGWQCDMIGNGSFPFQGGQEVLEAGQAPEGEARLQQGRQRSLWFRWSQRSAAEFQND